MTLINYLWGSMSLGQKLKNKKISSTGLVVVTVLLSLLSFSGFAIYPAQQKQIEKTELVVAIKQSRKTTHFFQRAVVASHENRFSLQLNSCQYNRRVLSCTLSVKTSFIDALSKVLSFRKPTPFLQSTHNPHPSDEDNFNSIRG